MQARPATKFLIENAYLRAPALSILLWRRNDSAVKLNCVYYKRLVAISAESRKMARTVSASCTS
jgi:hypothetical protein